MSTEPVAAATPAAPVTKPSIAEEFLAAYKAEPAPAAEPAPELKVEAQAPAPSEDPKPEPKAEEPKVEPKVETPSLARRLATLAAAEKRAKAEAEARAAKDAEIAPVLERLNKAKSAKSKAEAARLALELDDEAEADLFLELHRKFEGKEPAPKDPEKELDARLEAKLEAKLKARDEAAAVQRKEELERFRAQHAADVIEVLDARGDDFPLVAIAPPSQVDIAAISEAWLSANGEIPAPEEVLKLFQDQRQEKLDERRKAAEAKKASEKPAPKVKAEGEASGAKKPVRGNEAPITAPRKLSIQEQFLQEYRASSGG